MSTENPIQRYDPDQEWITNGMYEWPDGDYVLFSDHETALAEEYGRGVTAGKKEALHYSPSEREYYGKHVAQNDCWKDLKRQLAEVAAERDRLKIERDGALHSSETWELLHAKVQEELDRLKAELASKQCRIAELLDRRFSTEP